MARPREPQGPPAPPPVQRVRLRYAKRGRMRFGSTRDFQRALERALRRAEVPIAFSSGFHPHPRISYANAAPTGAASEAEYVELALAQRVDPVQLRAALDGALPEGLDVVEVVEAGPGALAERLEASDWQVQLRGLDPEPVTRAVAAYLAVAQAPVTRMLKTGARVVDTRAAVVSMRVDDGPAASHSTSPERCAILRMVVRHTTPAVRPDDILAALRAVAGLEPPTPPLVTRLAQGPLQDATGRVADPLATDEKADGAW